MTTKKINSVFIAAWYPHEKKHHFGIFIKEHARATSMFCDVSVIYLRFFKQGLVPKIEFQEEKQEKINVFYLNVFSPIRKYGIHDSLVKKAYKKALIKINGKHKIDIIHLNVRDKITKLVTGINFIKEKPIIVTEHFSFYHTGIKKLPISEQQKETKEIKSWFSNPKIKYILPVSSELGNVLATNFDVDKNKIRIIPNVASKQFLFAPKTNKGIIKIALVANWQAPKNPILFLKTLEQLKDKLKSKVSIDWIGEGPQLDAVMDFVKSNLDEYDIKFWGLQEKEVVGDVLRKADFLVHPTDAENLPTIIIESLCCGTPVLTHNVNGIPELIDYSNGIMCEPKSIDSFAFHLIKMIVSCRSYDYDLISKNANQLFSQRAISNQIKEIYDKVLNLTT